MNNQLGIKKIVLLVVGLVIILASLEWFWRYLHIGNIIITTNNAENAITLTETNSGNTGGAPLQIFNARGKLSVTVGLGQYIASVKDGARASTQLINLSSHKTLRYEIDPVSPASAEPVVSQNAQNIIASNGQLTYLNSTTSNLNKIDAKNNLTTLSPSQLLQTVRWANASYGIGEDASQNLYSIDNGSTSFLNMPFANINSNISFDVAPNRQIYVSSGPDIYMGSRDESFKKIYTVPSSSSSLVLGAAVNKVAFGYGTSSDEADNSNDDWIAVVNASGKVIKTDDVDEDVSSLVWSPNQLYLASLNEPSVSIYDSSLHRTASIPTAYPAGAATWFGNNKLIYSEGNAIWLYNLSSHKADLLTNLPSDDYATSLAIDTSDSYLYITSENPTAPNNSSILRIGLQGQ